MIELGLKGGQASIDDGYFLAADFETSKAQFEFYGLRHLRDVLIRFIWSTFYGASTARRQRETIVNVRVAIVTSNKCRGS